MQVGDRHSGRSRLINRSRQPRISGVLPIGMPVFVGPKDHTDPELLPRLGVGCGGDQVRLHVATANRVRSGTDGNG